jgi:deazaflavin-dependent oxidoreductase (nitroreductase family)
MTTAAHEPCAEGEAADRSDPNAFNDSVIQEFRANGGTVGGELADMQLLLLTTIGAKSGRPHTTPLAYHEDGDRYFVIASNGGAPTNPDWYHNLRTHPRTTVEISTETFEAIATILDPLERDRVFVAIAAQAPAAGEFQSLAGRTIPVIALEPTNGASDDTAADRSSADGDESVRSAR